MSSKVAPASHIPVVDLRTLGADPSDAGYRRVGQELVNALTTFGSAYVVNHGVPDDAVKKMFEVSAEFFSLPEDEKNSFKWDGFHGYISVGRQSMKKNYDLRESLDIARKNGPLPDARVPQLRGVWALLNSHLSALAVQIFKAIEYGLGWEENKLVNAHSETLGSSEENSILRLTYYPPVPADCPPNTVRLTPHTDFGSLTLDIQDEHEGLEVRNLGGDWVRATCPQKNAILVLIGDTLEHWSNGKLRATEHRVTVPEDNRLRTLPRTSVILGCVPNARETLAPFGGSPSERSHCTVKEYMSSGLIKTLSY